MKNIHNDKVEFDQHSSQEKIPIIEEQLNISTKEIETGTVTIRKEVATKEGFLKATLIEDDVEIQRVKIGRVVEAPPPAIRYEGNTMIVSVVREELIVHRQLVLDEELHITKHKVEKEVREPFEIKKEVVKVKEDAPGADH
jgi:stress response protein YsnF